MARLVAHQVDNAPCSSPQSGLWTVGGWSLRRMAWRWPEIGPPSTHFEQLLGPDRAVFQEARDDLAGPGIAVHANQRCSQEQLFNRVAGEVIGAEQDQRLLPDRVPSHALGKREA